VDLRRGFGTGTGGDFLMPRTKRTEEPAPPQPLPLGDNVTDNDLIAENHKIEDQIKDRLKAIEDDLFARLVARMSDSTKTDAGTAYISRLATVKIDNNEQLFDFAADNWDKYGDEVKVVISKAGVDKFMEDNNGQLPPGISLSKYSKLNIRRS
jgi:hypothetical protein